MKAILPLVVLLALRAQTFAVPIALDGFATGVDDYSVGNGNLVGQGPGITGFSGNWIAGSDASPDVIATGLDVQGAAASGGAVVYDANGRCGRLLTQPYNNSSNTTIFVGVMIQLANVGSGYRAFEMHNGGFDDGGNRVLQIATGEPGDGAVGGSEFAFRVNNTNDHVTSLGAQDTNVNFFVMRIDLVNASGQDSITLYRNPTDFEVEGNNTGTTLSGFDFRFGRLSLARFGDDDITFDELRIGTSFRDVTETSDLDSDGDGMDDGWELMFGLTIGVNDSMGDELFDNDGLTNFQEFRAGTNPNLADTDGDGIDDKPETEGTENAFDGKPTLPAEADTDGDRVNDGDEVGTANGFVTDPNTRDTDGDGEDDGIELAEGTDPLDETKNSAALGRIVVDGRKDALYGDALVLQTVETGFGDNFSELNAGYAKVIDDRLHLLFTGNIESNFNKLHVFIDAAPGGSQTFNSAGNDNTERMNGLVFDAEFMPEYHLIVRRGSDGNGPKFDLDFANLGTDEFAFYERVFGAAVEGRGMTGNATQSTFGTDPSMIGIAHDNANDAGVGGNTGASADEAAAAAVDTGVEMSISLADLGLPSGEVKICAFVGSGSHDTVSNQFLAGLPVGSGNQGDPVGLSLANVAGDQFFTVPVKVIAPRIINVEALEVTAELAVEFESIPGKTYTIEVSDNLVDWDLESENFPASDGETSRLILDVVFGAGTQFYVRITQN